MIDQFKHRDVVQALNNMHGPIKDAAIYAERLQALPAIAAADPRLALAQSKIAALRNILTDADRLAGEVVTAVTESNE